nr:hypothetical protein Iba_scaffold3961.4CG0700 [Ipomoea batatas]
MCSLTKLSTSHSSCVIVSAIFPRSPSRILMPKYRLRLHVTKCHNLLGENNPIWRSSNVIMGIWKSVYCTYDLVIHNIFHSLNR